MRKWLSYCKNYTIVRVAKSKKKGAAVKRHVFFCIVFSWKNDPKIIQKVLETQIGQKTAKKTVLGTIFLRKNWIFGDSGVPGRSLGKVLGRILEGKFGDEKKVEKKRVKVIASEGYAMAGKEGLGRING